MTDMDTAKCNSNQKILVLGCCATGAKFTPMNHKITGNRLLDAISCGDTIPVTLPDIERELKELYQLGCRYYHIHARNPQTREQSCENDLYTNYGRIIANYVPKMILSYGASRNGVEVAQSVRDAGEWERISQIELPLDCGGAHLVTAQAAVELQIVCDMERRGFISLDHGTGEFRILRPLAEYIPSSLESDIKLEVNSTDNGKNYGKSSPNLQFQVLKRSLKQRCDMGLPYEVEWVQRARSRFLTWFMLHEMGPELAEIGRLNICVLFGFSPKLPFPTTYSDFRAVVAQAKSVASGHSKEKEFRISVTVGAAVLPQHAANLTLPMDIGPMSGSVISPTDRIVGYASQRDSGVDVVRVGLEDTPYKIDKCGTIIPTTNVDLVETARRTIELNDAIVADGPCDHPFFDDLGFSRTASPCWSSAEFGPNAARAPLKNPVWIV
jgi:uncharacterized protein (DUF849 family)